MNKKVLGGSEMTKVVCMILEWPLSRISSWISQLLRNAHGTISLVMYTYFAFFLKNI